jgi:hypothetical protein
VSADAAAAWGGDEPDYHREWPECRGRCTDRACALLFTSPRCCYVARRHYNDAEHRAAATPYTSQLEVVGDGALMGYWANNDFYCRK